MTATGGSIASGVLAKPALDVGLVSRAAAALAAFYAEAFGFERLDPLTLPTVGTIHRLAAGGSVLRVLQPETPPEADPGEWNAREGIRYLTLEVRDLDAVVSAVEAAGGRVVLAAFALRPGRRVAQVADPDGNVLELGEGDG